MDIHSERMAAGEFKIDTNQLKAEQHYRQYDGSKNLELFENE